MMGIKDLKRHMEAQRGIRASRAMALIENAQKIEFGHLTIAPEKKVAIWKDRPVTLTARGMALLIILVKQQGKWISRADVVVEGFPLLPDEQAVSLAFKHLKSRIRRADYSCRCLSRNGSMLRWEDHSDGA